MRTAAAISGVGGGIAPTSGSSSPVGMEETPRANGRGWIVRDDDLLARCEVRGKVLLAAAPWLIRCRRVVPSEVEQALRP